MEKIYIKGEEMPVVAGRLCKHRGILSVEVSCPYCGTLHYHSPEPVPGIRVSHCGIPCLCQKGSYYIKMTFLGSPQPKRQSESWLNCRGEKVKVLKAKNI